MALLEREAFLDQLAAQLVAARRGRGSLALVIGEAGIGKTSLVEAFRERADQPVRVLWGTCDPLVPPRPFAPVVDIAERTGGELRAALEEGRRDAVIEALLRALQRPDAPTLVVMDDLHWADHATLDLIRVLGRRVARLPALVIGTFRDHDVGAEHPLRLALGDIPRGSIVELHLPPLSVDAVALLAGPRRVEARAIHASTGGNPFFVTEVLAAAPSDAVPTSVRDGVLARAGRVSRGASAILRASAVLGSAVPGDVLLRVAGEAPMTLEECQSMRLLEEHDGGVSFRHELARRAVLDAIPADQQQALHRRCLATFIDLGWTDQARLARHAIGANDGAAVLEYARAAADAATSLGSHREAAAFLRSALDHGGALPARERAELFEAYAREASITDDAVAAVHAQRQAVRTWEAVGDAVRLADAMVHLSAYLWFVGEPDEAMAVATVAADRLERAAPDSPSLARALAASAQRLLVAGSDDQEALARADRAVELAERLGDERTAVHALTTRSVLQIYIGDEAGWEGLEAAVARSQAASLPEGTARALVNLVEAARDMRRLHLADRYLAETAAFLDEHELDVFTHILVSRMAGLELDTGRWDDAIAHATALLDMPGIATPVRVRALTVLGHIRARRAQPGAWSLLDAALEISGSEYQDLAPLHVSRAETAWLEGDMERARTESARGLALGDHHLAGWWWSELAFWGWMAGAEDPLPVESEPPFWLHVSGRPRDAAAAWLEVGAPYHAALALVSAGGEPDLRDALRIFNELGAVAMARRVVSALQALGVGAIPRGPRPATRANPARLTDRQLEVLALLASGLTNAEIARRLVVSGKTVDHHVSAVLQKLGVRSRAEAADAARKLGVTWGSPAGDGEVARSR